MLLKASEGIQSIRENRFSTYVCTYEDKADVLAARDARVGLSLQGKGGLLGKPPLLIAIEATAELVRDKAIFEEHWNADLERWWPARYKAGDILRYETGSKAHGIARKSTAIVLSAGARNNTVTIQREDGQAVTYDPKRLKGVNVYREMLKDFATGDRIQFTAKDKDLGVNNRDLGTITRLESGQITVRLDGKNERTIQFGPAKMRHFDHGYAVTSHVSQGLTEGRVIANIDTESARSLINTRLAYESISRAEYDARIYTNGAEALGARLATNISKTSAVDFRRSTQSASQERKAAQVYEYADPEHRLAAVALTYREHPAGTVVIAKDHAERRELNQLIRADLQAGGLVSRDSKRFSVRIEQDLTNRQSVAQYVPGDIIQYKQGSPSLQGIPNDSGAVIVSTNLKSNQLTVRTSHGDEVTYSPHLTKTMTAESKVYREEQQEFAQGDRIRLTEADPKQGIRKGDFATIAAVNDAGGFEVRLDKGKSAQLTIEQARHIEYGNAVDALRTGAPERVLISSDGLLTGPLRAGLDCPNGERGECLHVRWVRAGEHYEAVHRTAEAAS